MKIINGQVAEVVPLANSRYTPELGAALVEEAAKTPSVKAVASACGVPYELLTAWLKRGADGDPAFELFTAQFEEARAAHERRYLEHLEEIAADDNPKVANARLQANKFLLQKHYRKQYGDQIFVSTMIEKQAEGYDLSVLPPDELRLFMRALKVVKANNEQNPTELKRSLKKLDDASRSRKSRS